MSLTRPRKDEPVPSTLPPRCGPPTCRGAPLAGQARGSRCSRESRPASRCSSEACDAAVIRSIRPPGAVAAASTACRRPGISAPASVTRAARPRSLRAFGIAGPPRDIPDSCPTIADLTGADNGAAQRRLEDAAHNARQRRRGPVWPAGAHRAPLKIQSDRVRPGWRSPVSPRTQRSRDGPPRARPAAGRRSREAALPSRAACRFPRIASGGRPRAPPRSCASERTSHRRACTDPRTGQ